MKNPFLAAVLGFVLGPIGLFYVSVRDGAIALGGVLLLSLLTEGIALLPLWIGCAIAGFMLANRANARLSQPATAQLAAPAPAASSVAAAPVASESGANKFCSGCGERLALTARFCKKCGTAAAA